MRGEQRERLRQGLKSAGFEMKFLSLSWWEQQETEDGILGTFSPLCKLCGGGGCGMEVEGRCTWRRW